MSSSTRNRRIANGFPIPEATDLRVLDVIYGTRGDRHRYLFHHRRR